MPSFVILWAFKPSILSPRNSIFPRLGLSNPDINLRSVDFPAPFGPIMALRDLFSTFKLSSSSTFAFHNRDKYSLIQANFPPVSSPEIFVLLIFL